MTLKMFVVEMFKIKVAQQYIFDSRQYLNCIPTGRTEETTWMPSDYLAEDSSRRPKVYNLKLTKAVNMA